MSDVRRVAGRATRVAKGAARRLVRSAQSATTAATTAVAPGRNRTPAEPPERAAVLRQLFWEPGGVLVLRGWSHMTGVTDKPGAPMRVVAANDAEEREIDFEVSRFRTTEVHPFSADGTADHVESGFEARLRATELVEVAGVFDRTWQIRTGLGDEPLGPFVTRYRYGSAGTLATEDIGEGSDSVLARPIWHAERGLSLAVARRNLSARLVEETDAGLLVDIAVRGGFDPIRAFLRADGHDELPVGLTPTDDGVSVLIEPGTLPPPTRKTVRWYVHLGDPDDRTRQVQWRGQGSAGRRRRLAAMPGVTVVHGLNGPLRLDVVDAALEVSAASLAGSADAPVLRVEGSAFGLDLADLTLYGPRQDVPAARLEREGDSFRADFPLVAVGDWASGPTVLRPGGYRVRSGGITAGVASAWVRSLHQRVSAPLLGARFEIESPGHFYFHLGTPRPDSETGPYPQSVIGRQHRRARVKPSDTVVLDCFDGRSATDNTLATFRELQARRPDLPCHWTVFDYSVELPDGAIPVLRYSEAWWQLLGSSRWVVTNCWLPADFRRRPHQRVLQTWHGTPLKRMGLDRIGALEREGYVEKMVAEVATWSMLVAQNPFSAEVFRRAYRFSGEMLEIGYPRNDLLNAPDAEGIRRRTRERLGLAPDETAILYVPTWREDDRLLYRELDFDKLQRDLGPGHRLLVRGHANTVLHDSTVNGDGLVDVTLYPDVTELYLAADVMITDYSSTMFDYSITGKPMIFFVPDLDRYTSELRGTYFSLAEEAPGPLLATTDEVVDAIRHPDPAAYAARYRAWQAKFNPYDDGHASARAVDALFR